MEKLSELKKDLAEQKEVLNADWADAETKKFAQIAIKSIEEEIELLEKLPAPSKQTPKDKSEVKKAVVAKYKALRKAKKVEKVAKKVLYKKKSAKRDIALDKTRKALHGGKRTSVSGKTYYENRPNRSDVDRRVKLKDGDVVGGAVGSEAEIQKRLEYLRKELRAERISYGELLELQSLAKHIKPNDVELLEAAGVPEYKKGGAVKSRYSKKADAKRRAKPAGYRYKITNKENPKYYKRPTAEEIAKGSKKIYYEKRKTKSDQNQSKKI
jgi:hypothetical protein